MSRGHTHLVQALRFPSEPGAGIMRNQPSDMTCEGPLHMIHHRCIRCRLWLRTGSHQGKRANELGASVMIFGTRLTELFFEVGQCAVPVPVSAKRLTSGSERPTPAARWPRRGETRGLTVSEGMHVELICLRASKDQPTREMFNEGGYPPSPIQASPRRTWCLSRSIFRLHPVCVPFSSPCAP